ncbi:MAG: alpha-N-acetylglucosaminidase TIM-barrel domain-containing protein [Bacteroidales bacterium]|nr:alpha-N-acetylglucosaminidase TIM-barrel domain-containing protein [Bacteroidales bacterium]
MKRRFATTAAAVLMAVCTMLAATSQVDEAMALAQRLSPRLAQKVTFKQGKKKAADYFTLANAGDKVIITANNANSMAVGLNRYLKKYCHTTVSWYADIALDLPAVLPAVDSTETVDARVPQRFFLNYCTFGYTMPFFDWHDWERVIDWMALNGVNMPLAITGQEGVWYNVWRNLGMTDEQVRGYFTGPVYLPWHRMANIDAWCGPLPKEWLDGQVKLQQQILARERALNMRPVLPAFAGHVPKQLCDLFPKADIKKLDAWDDFEAPYHTYFLNSEDPLYAKIQRAFLEEQTRLFGTDHIYGIDLFNEMEAPSYDCDYIAGLSKHVYESLRAVDKKAEWLQMGWFLYYQRKKWTPEVTKAMLTALPKGKMTMLDYFCERMEVWRMHDKFYGQPYIWCYLGNFGGNSVMQGNVKQSGELLEKALQEGGANLKGIGSTLEGFDVQQFPFEYIFDKAWNFGASDAEVVRQVADCHADVPDENVRRAWDVLYNKVLTKPSTTFRGTAANGFPYYKKLAKRSRAFADMRALNEAWQLLLKQKSVTVDAAKIDLIWTGRELLGNLFGYEKDEFDSAMVARDTVKMREKAIMMRSLLADLDMLNAQHPFCTVDKWIEQARDYGVAPEVKDYYEMNARRLITTWGGDLNDYAIRNYSGVIANYQARRWEIYIDEAFRSVRTATPFRDKERTEATHAFELTFATHYGEQFPHYPDVELLSLSRTLASKYAQELNNWLSK